MSEWQAGDFAICVDDTQTSRVPGDMSPAECRDGLSFLVRGRSYTIDRVILHWSGKQGVWLVGQTSRAPYAADRFAKVRPDEREACEPEFVTLLNRIKRKVSA